jgi:DNA-directed RNA polymerase specialized sigma24 family protein
VTVVVPHGVCNNSLMSPADYQQLLNLARRRCRSAAEAEDLLQDALVAALADGRSDFSAATTRRWLAGVIRNHGAFRARSAGRQRRRETAWTASLPQQLDAPASPPSIADALDGLPPSLRLVAALALSGHTRREIAYLLRLTDTALRQRVSALKRHLAARGIGLPSGLPGLTLNLSYGRIRDALLPQLQRQAGLFASHDPDGHLFIIRGA